MSVLGMWLLGSILTAPTPKTQDSSRPASFFRPQYNPPHREGSYTPAFSFTNGWPDSKCYPWTHNPWPSSPSDLRLGYPFSLHQTQVSRRSHLSQTEDSRSPFLFLFPANPHWLFFQAWSLTTPFPSKQQILSGTKISSPGSWALKAVPDAV